MIDIFDSSNLIRVQVQHVKLRERLKVLNLLNVVLAEHEDSKRANRVQVVDLFNVIVVEVQEYQVGQADQVFNPRDQIVLQVEQSEALFALQQRHVAQFSLVQLEALWVGSSLAWLPVDDEDARDLRQLSEDDLVLIFNAANDSIGQQVAIPLIIFILVQPYYAN